MNTLVIFIWESPPDINKDHNQDIFLTLQWRQLLNELCVNTAY